MTQDSVDRHVARWRDELDYLDPVHESIVARLMILSRHLTEKGPAHAHEHHRETRHRNLQGRSKMEAHQTTSSQTIVAAASIIVDGERLSRTSDPLFVIHDS